jgi:hypothetical protein
MVPLSICAVIINLFVSIAATKCGLVYGPVLGTTICLAGVQLWWMLLLMRDEFGIAPKDLLGALAVPAAVALPYAALVAFCAYRWMPTHWATLGLEMAGSAMGLALIYFNLLLGAAERRNLLARARSIFYRAALRPSPLAQSGVVPIPAVADAKSATEAAPEEPGQKPREIE